MSLIRDPKGRNLITEDVPRGWPVWGEKMKVKMGISQKRRVERYGLGALNLSKRNE